MYIQFIKFFDCGNFLLIFLFVCMFIFFGFFNYMYVCMILILFLDKYIGTQLSHLSIHIIPFPTAPTPATISIKIFFSISLQQYTLNKIQYNTICTCISYQ